MIKENLIKVRNELYDKLPRGDISSDTFELISIIGDHLRKLDNIIDNFSSEKNHIAVICQNLIDFNDWRFKNDSFKISNIIKKNLSNKFEHDNSIYIAVNNIEKIIGYRFDKLIETENAFLNPNYKKIKDDIKICLKK